MVGGWRLAVGGDWQLVAVGGGWRLVMVGGWWRLAVGGPWDTSVTLPFRLTGSLTP